MASRTWLYAALVGLAVFCAVMAAKVLTNQTAGSSPPTPQAPARQSPPSLAIVPAHQQAAAPNPGGAPVGALPGGKPLPRTGALATYAPSTVSLPPTVPALGTPIGSVQGTLSVPALPSTPPQPATAVPTVPPVLNPVAAATATAAAAAAVNSIYPTTGATGTNL